MLSGCIPTITNKGQMERIKLGHKIVYLVFYRSHKRVLFDSHSFDDILSSFKELLTKFNETEIGLVDNFNSISKFQLSTMEKRIGRALVPIVPYWITQGKIPKNKSEFILRQQENKLLTHPGQEKLYQFITDKGYYWIGMKKDIADVLRTYEFCQMHKKDNAIRRPPMQISDTPQQSFEKIAIDIVKMDNITTERGNKYAVTI